MSPPDEPPRAGHFRFALPIAMAISLAPAIVGIWSGRWFVTQDGPAHLYNARVIIESRDPLSPYASTYEVRAKPLPNWGGHILYLALGALLPTASAERAAATVTFVLLAATTAWLRRRVCPDDGIGGIVATAALATILGLNVTWLFGFTGFLLGAAMMPLTLALWWDGRHGMGSRRAMVLAGMVVLGYFCHPVSLGLTAFSVVVLAVASPSEGSRRSRIGWTLVGLSPLLPLGLIYRQLTRAGGPMRPEWGALAKSLAPRAWYEQFGWADPISLAAKVYRPFGTEPSSWNGLTAPAVWVGLGLLALTVATLRDRGRGRGAWGLIGLAMIVAGVVGPDTIGASHGHYLPQRVVLLGLVALVPWLGLDRPGVIAWAGRGCLVVALGFQSLFVWDYAEESRRTAGRLVAATDVQDSRVAAVLLDIRGRFRANPLLHADCLLGVGTGNIIWGDYETNYYYFPVQLRDPSTSPPASALEAIARLDGPAQAEERSRQWSALINRNDSSIDVVIIWGSDPAIESATSRRFIRISNDGQVQVWVRAGLGLRHRPAISACDRGRTSLSLGEPLANSSQWSTALMALLDAELAFVKELALEAAAVARARAAGAIPQEKANQSYVTDLDHDLELLIRGRLAERFPDDVLTGEEYAASGGTGPRRWSIDPIDGTGNLVHLLPLWAISIGLVDRGEPVLGVIAIPPLGELFWAVKGQGTFLDGKRLVVRDSESLHGQDNICVGTNVLRNVDPRSLPGRLRDLGSACCELTFVASGRLAACTFLGEHAHDVAAGIVITSEAGCSIGTIDGRHLTPAEFFANTPVPVPTFIAPPGRLAALMAVAKRFG